MTRVFIDGKEGTTGLRIFDRLSSRDDVEMITLPEEIRKDTKARREAINSSDIVFLCLPDAAARESVSLAENENVVIIDTSTAHRTSPEWAYGFPELSVEHRSRISSSKRIAVPGCHASGFISLIYPLVKNGIIGANVELTCHSITGYSGGGKKMIAEYEASGRDRCLDAPRQYGLTQQHKHLKEMREITGLTTAPVFCPIVSDFYSGMVVTVPLFKSQICDKMGISDIKRVYSQLYNGSIVSYSDDIGENGMISAISMSGKDGMEIFVEGNDDRILLISRFDNLGKGASGAAVECMNIVMGKEETKDLTL